MKKTHLYLLLFIVSYITSCDPEYSYILPRKPKCWERLVGNYTVYDTANNITYSMSIEHRDSIIPGFEPIDSLIITNYANKFNLRVGYGCYTEPDLLRFSNSFPTYDHNYKRWHLWINDNDPATAKYENQLKNDTIVLYFNLDNIAFYASDGVSYYSADQKHIAVKQR